MGEKTCSNCGFVGEIEKHFQSITSQHFETKLCEDCRTKLRANHKKYNYPDYMLPEERRAYSRKKNKEYRAMHRERLARQKREYYEKMKTDEEFMAKRRQNAIDYYWRMKNE